MSAFNKAVLCLDLGAKTGWAIGRTGSRIVSGTAINSKEGRFEGGGMRFLRFQHWLNETKDVYHPIGAVYFEEVRRHLGVDAAHAYGGYLATLTSWCENANIPYASVPVGTIKKFITGKGNASKGEVLDAVAARGTPAEDDNEADALALLYYVIGKYGEKQ